MTPPVPSRPYRSTLGPLLAMSERRLADRSHPADLRGVADAIVRRQRAVTTEPRRG